MRYCFIIANDCDEEGRGVLCTYVRARDCLLCDVRGSPRVMGAIMTVRLVFNGERERERESERVDFLREVPFSERM